MERGAAGGPWNAHRALSERCEGGRLCRGFKRLQQPPWQKQVQRYARIWGSNIGAHRATKSRRESLVERYQNQEALILRLRRKPMAATEIPAITLSTCASAM